MLPAVYLIVLVTDHDVQSVDISLESYYTLLIAAAVHVHLNRLLTLPRSMHHHLSLLSLNIHNVRRSNIPDDVALLHNAPSDRKGGLLDHP